MTTEFEHKLEKYAEVIVKVGLNIQPGQRLLIGPPMWGAFGTELEFVPLVRLVAKKAYQAGASLVDVMWRDDQLSLIRLGHAPPDSLEEFPAWRSDGAIDAAKAGDAILMIFAPNQFLFADQDLDLDNKVFRTGMKHMKPFLDLRGKRAMSFAIVAAVSEGWADIVYPDLPPEDRKGQLWETVFETCRVNQSDPVLAWKEHVFELETRCKFLNGKKYSTLHLTASGTDLRVGLPAGHVWMGGSLTTQNGIEFVANIPTEEIFSIPHKDKTEGVVTSTKPMGLIDGLSLTFSNGKVIKASARKGEELLYKYLETDNGVKHLGEVALVPHSSPISQSRLLFENLLFDENASCHLALGNAYRFCLEGGEEMLDEEFSQAGGNNSHLHIDFMIGSDEMDVDGIKEDGSTEPIMRGGELAFDV